MRVNGSPSTCVIQKSKRRFRYDRLSYDTYICT